MLLPIEHQLNDTLHRCHRRETYDSLLLRSYARTFNQPYSLSLTTSALRRHHQHLLSVETFSSFSSCRTVFPSAFAQCRESFRRANSSKKLEMTSIRPPHPISSTKWPVAVGRSHRSKRQVQIITWSFCYLLPGHLLSLTITAITTIPPPLSSSNRTLDSFDCLLACLPWAINLFTCYYLSFQTRLGLCPPFLNTHSSSPPPSPPRLFLVGQFM